MSIYYTNMSILHIKYCNRVNGDGLYTSVSVQANQKVFTLSGELFNIPTKYTIHVGNNWHIYDKHGIYMNHSFEPNTKICGFDVVALVDIQPDDELTFNYNDSEVNMADPFMVNSVMVNGTTVVFTSPEFGATGPHSI